MFAMSRFAAAVSLAFLALVVGAGCTDVEPGSAGNGSMPIPANTGSPVLDRTIDVHGGLARWREMGTMSYRLEGFPLTPRTALRSVSTVDLVSRSNRIDSSAYTVGWNGQQAWSMPGKDASGLPSRFYSLGSFYFIGMPFVFTDGGAHATDSSDVTWRGKTYKTVKVAYDKGTGKSDADDYVLLIDPATYQLAAIHHSVTEAKIDRVTWAFDGWQRVDGLLVPAKLNFYMGFNPVPGEGKTTVVSEMKFEKQRPNPSLYAVPAGAVVSE